MAIVINTIYTNENVLNNLGYTDVSYRQADVTGTQSTPDNLISGALGDIITIPKIIISCWSSSTVMSFHADTDVIFKIRIGNPETIVLDLSTTPFILESNVDFRVSKTVAGSDMSIHYWWIQD